MSNLSNYIASLPKSQAQIFSILRNIVFDVGSHVQEKVSYNIPFFYFHRPLCYLSPTFDGMYIGFVRGSQLSNEHVLLEKKNKKFVRSIHFYSLAELEGREEIIRQILNEAAILNEYHSRQKKKKKQTK
ncbi:MAG: DUF1801 domain-containing protein [Cyclobacteriaceae bacterium]|nr:DUF1801 domain-containing protein [Cyclobacteriaceae bacterium]